MDLGFFQKKLQHDFPKMREGVKGPLELFRKFICFGSEFSKVISSNWLASETMKLLLQCFWPQGKSNPGSNSTKTWVKLFCQLATKEEAAAMDNQVPRGNIS